MSREYEHINISKPRPISPDLSHDLQLLRDVDIVNARTVAELGLLPSGGLPGPPKRKYVPLQSTDAPEYVKTNFDDQEDEAMKLNHATAISAALTLAGTLVACDMERAYEIDTPRKTKESTVIPKHIEEIILQVMGQQYGEKFNRGIGCWEYASKTDDDVYEYCMKPSAPQIISTESGQRIFFFAYGESSITNVSKYAYSLNDFGLMGAFEILIEPDKWALLAASKSMTFGSSGDCGCKYAKFTKLGKDYYGWMFSSGTTWQGVSLVYHNLVAPKGDKFEDLSQIPMVEGEKSNVEYQIKIDDSNPEEQVFPIIVTKTDVGITKSFKVDFDHTKWRYVLPKGN